MTYDRGDILVAPFRYTDIDQYKLRPVLVLSKAAAFAGTDHVIAAMITSANRSAWPLDVPVEAWREAGLNKPCLVRMKLATIAVETIEARLGRMDDRTMRLVQARTNEVLGPSE